MSLAGQIGQPVCALLSGGGYAEFVAVPEGQLMPVPDTVELPHAAALPEVACTVWSNVVMTAACRPARWCCFTAAPAASAPTRIQVARALDCRVAVTAGSTAKLDLCKELGAEILINYRDEDFVERLREATDGAGADVILDIMGAAYLDRNVDALASRRSGCRHRHAGRHQGRAERGQAARQARRGDRHRRCGRGRRDGPSSKSEVVAEVVRNVWPMVADGRVRPIVGAEFPIEQAAAAHELLNSGDVSGKVLLRVAD